MNDTTLYIIISLLGVSFVWFVISVVRANSYLNKRDLNKKKVHPYSQILEFDPNDYKIVTEYPSTTTQTTRKQQTPPITFDATTSHN